MYEYLYSLINKYSADVATIKLKTVNENSANTCNETKEKIHTYDFEGIYANMNSKNFWCLCSNLHKKELFNEMPHDLPLGLIFCEDMLMNYFVYKNVKTLVASNLEKYYYYRHSESAIDGKLNYSIINDAVLAYNIIDNDFKKSSPAYPFSVGQKITNDLFLLNSIIRNNICWDKYEPLRKDILSHAKYIFSEKCSSHFFCAPQNRCNFT